MQSSLLARREEEGNNKKTAAAKTTTKQQQQKSHVPACLTYLNNRHCHLVCGSLQGEKVAVAVAAYHKLNTAGVSRDVQLYNDKHIQ